MTEKSVEKLLLFFLLNLQNKDFLLYLYSVLFSLVLGDLSAACGQHRLRHSFVDRNPRMFSELFVA